mmetsp:Transcript_41787/g.48118  ORF Transcript_41787/g.48118 Transcript_41787/m.48118 type:complete len:448 (-) Transcript_41787:129-1472(-)
MEVLKNPLFSDFFSRLKTYTFQNWSAKPDMINPIACCSRGFFVKSSETVQCNGCGVTLTFPNGEDDGVEKLLVKSAKFLKEMTTAHRKHCKWEYADKNMQELGLYESILKEIYLTWEIDFKKRRDSFTDLKTFPQLEGRVLSRILKEKDLTLLWSDSKVAHPKGAINIPTILSLFGWNMENGVRHSEHYTMKCHFCLREVNSEAFKSSAKTMQVLNDTEGSPSDFNSITEHRYYCVWVRNTLSQWKTLENGKEHISSENEGWAICHSLLELKYSLPDTTTPTGDQIDAVMKATAKETNQEVMPAATAKDTVMTGAEEEKSKTTSEPSTTSALATTKSTIEVAKTSAKTASSGGEIDDDIQKLVSSINEDMKASSENLESTKKLNNEINSIIEKSVGGSSETVDTTNKGNEEQVVVVDETVSKDTTNKIDKEGNTGVTEEKPDIVMDE